MRSLAGCRTPGYAVSSSGSRLMPTSSKAGTRNQGKPFWTASRIVLSIVALVVVAMVASTFFSRGTENLTSAPSAPTSGGPVELPGGIAEASFQMLDGSKARLTDYKGKVVVLDLWATWCGPCRLEIPHLIQIGKEFKDRGVEVVGLTVEEPASAIQAVRSFAAAFNIDYSIGFAPQELQSALLRQPTIPQTLIIGKDGKLYKQFIGFNQHSVPPAMRAAIELALKSS
jgi:thiol-disulfide isomerase/thioredoxin